MPPLIPDAKNASENNIDGDMIVDEKVDRSPENESEVLQSRLSGKKNKLALTGKQRPLGNIKGY